MNGLRVSTLQLECPRTFMPKHGNKGAPNAGLEALFPAENASWIC